LKCHIPKQRKTEPVFSLYSKQEIFRRSFPALFSVLSTVAVQREKRCLIFSIHVPSMLRHYNMEASLGKELPLKTLL